MWNQRLFRTTRGKVLLLLKRYSDGTVASLSRELDLTPNAIRQHLSALERDNLVIQQPRRIGRSKPTQVYSLTPAAETLFPKQYDTLLSQLVRELVVQQGSPGVVELLARLGSSAAAAHRNRLSRLDLPERIQEVQRIMEENGTIAEVEETEDGVLLRDYNCPYAAVVRDHPEVCQVQSNFLRKLLEPAGVSTDCDRRTIHCQFRIMLPAAGSGLA